MQFYNSMKELVKDWFKENDIEIKEHFDLISDWDNNESWESLMDEFNLCFAYKRDALGRKVEYVKQMD